MGEQLTLTGETWPPPRRAGPIERAWLEGDDEKTVEAVVAKCCQLLDSCNSGRDTKALAVTVLDGVKLRRELRGAGGAEDEESPLNGIIYKFKGGLAS